MALLARRLLRLRRCCGRLDRLGRKAQLHPRAACAGNLFRGVAQLDMAAMLFEDAADDGEPEPGALFTRGHVRLEQARAVLLGQSDAVVDDIDDDVLAVAAEC